MPTRSEITWERHDEIETAHRSTCGRFETSIDPVYGYHRLHLSEDTTASLGESRSLADLARLAERLLANGHIDRALAA